MAAAKHDTNAPAESVHAPAAVLCFKHRNYGLRAYNCGGGGCQWEELKDPYGRKKGLPPIKVIVPGQEDRGHAPRGGYRDNRRNNQQNDGRRWDNPNQGAVNTVDGAFYHPPPGQAGSSGQEHSGNGPAAPSAQTNGTNRL